MTFTKTTEGDTLTIVVNGNIDTISAPILEQDISPALNDINAIVFDVTDVEYMSSAGLRLLGKVRRTIENVSLRNPNNSLRQILKLTQFEKLIKII